VDRLKLKNGARVALDMTTLTIMRVLPREVDPTVYNMMKEDPGNVTFSQVGGLGDQIRELREACCVVFNGVRVVLSMVFHFARLWSFR
jgi:26S proteasome regulatory subunit T4